MAVYDVVCLDLYGEKRLPNKLLLQAIRESVVTFVSVGIGT